MTGELQNANPIVYRIAKDIIINDNLDNIDEDERDFVTPDEIFDLIRNLNDPEHPLTLEQLNVRYQPPTTFN